MERIVAERVQRDSAPGISGEQPKQYLVKWHGLPYTECSWEDEEDLQVRENNLRCSCCGYLSSRLFGVFP